LERALTIISANEGRILLSNTEESFNEVDRLAVKHFLNTLAEIVLAIASRNSKDMRLYRLIYWSY
jgi:uncharacterized protein YutE (UPF0331/DUF86 family)